MKLSLLTCLTMTIFWIWLATCMSSGSDSKPIFLEIDRDPFLSATSTDARWYPCGDWRCRCSNITASCRNDNLSYVPQLPRGITLLEFGSEAISALEDDLFLNVSGITCLRVMSMQANSVSIGVFSSLTNLTYLDLRSNDFPLDVLASVSRIPNLKVLELWYSPLHGQIPGDTFAKYPMPRLQRLVFVSLNFKSLNWTVFSPLQQLKELALCQNGIVEMKDTVQGYLPRLQVLDLTFNQLENVHLTSFSFLTQLQVLDLTNNAISNRSFTDLLPQLRVLNLRENKFVYMPDTCERGSSLFPSLKELDLSNNELVLIFQNIICLPALQTLHLNGNKLIDAAREAPIFLFNHELFPSLEAVDVSRQQHDGVLYIVEDSFRNPSLKSINLSYNSQICFEENYLVDVDTFKSCPNLEVLIAIGTDFKGVDENRFQRLFGHLTHLREFSLRSTGISRITKGMFRGLNSLSLIDFSGNHLIHIPDGVFLFLVQLTSFNMSNNQILEVQESAFSPILRGQLQQVDLSGNRFVCSCEVMWFRQWLLSNPSLFHDWSDGYMCDNVHNKSVQEFYLPGQRCLWSEDTNKFITVTVSLLFFTIMGVALLYRYRWHIRLAMYDGRGDRLQRNFQQPHYQYDVFVSYDSEDFDWVHNCLRPQLEDGLGLRLCLHERDFTPGVPIVRNIMRSVETSKKMMMIFSQGFAESQWCQFELQLCLTHVMDTGDALLVVLLNNIQPRELTPTMMAVMKTTTYIEWADDPDARDAFWGRIPRALYDILPHG